jgi:hypothetical protein
MLLKIYKNSLVLRDLGRIVLGKRRCRRHSTGIQDDAKTLASGQTRDNLNKKM